MGEWWGDGRRQVDGGCSTGGGSREWVASGEGQVRWERAGAPWPGTACRKAAPFLAYSEPSTLHRILEITSTEHVCGASSSGKW